MGDLPATSPALRDWELAAGSAAVHVVPDGRDLATLVSGLDADAPVVVAEADSTPGPDLVRWLLAALATVDVVDARVLPVEVTPGPEADVEEEVAAASDPRPRVSGVCVAATATTMSALVEVLTGARDERSGAALEAVAAGRELSLTTEVRATIVRHRASTLVGGAPGEAHPVEWPPPPPHTHPALLESTLLRRTLDAAGVEWRAAEEEQGDARNRPFLTVVTRTQGRREQCLSDVLACLSAQTLRDFEWLVACHNATPSEMTTVRRVLSQAAPWLAERTRVIEVERPGRAAPLNDAFGSAEGRYVAVLDDDDTVLSSWVSMFRGLEDGHAGRILRAVALRQSVAALDVGGDPVAVSVGNPRPEWPVEFDVLAHLVHNQTPFMSVAIPRGAFHSLRLRFDETLDTTEDWDFLVRVAALLGVRSSSEVTSVYRWWLEGQTSRDLHDQQAWDESRRRVLEGFDDLTLTINGRDVHALRSRLEAVEAELAELAREHHDVILTLDRTATEHQKTVDNWRASEEKVAELKDKLATARARFKRRLELIEQVEDLMRSTGAEPPETSVYEMTPQELSALLQRLQATPEPRARFGRRSR